MSRRWEKKISRTDSRSLVIWADINLWQETSRMNHLFWSLIIADCERKGMINEIWQKFLQKTWPVSIIWKNPVLLADSIKLSKQIKFLKKFLSNLIYTVLFPHITKEGCVLLMVVVSLLPNGKIGQNDHRKYAPHFMNSCSRGACFPRGHLGWFPLGAI